MFFFQSSAMSLNISHRYSHFYRMLVKTQFLIYVRQKLHYMTSLLHLNVNFKVLSLVLIENLWLISCFENKNV